jgi:hypothetical protein
MRLLQKIMLIWLLALAVPVQSLASTAGFLCTFGGHGVATVNTATPCHFETEQTATHAPSIKTDHHSATKCSACASCCVGFSAVLGTFSVLSAAITRGVHAPAYLALFVSHIPQRLHPPPKSILI